MSQSASQPVSQQASKPAGESVVDGRLLRLQSSGSFAAGADGGGRGGVHQRHVHPLSATLGADDLREALRAWLTQKLT